MSSVEAETVDTFPFASKSVLPASFFGEAPDDAEDDDDDEDDDAESLLDLLLLLHVLRCLLSFRDALLTSLRDDDDDVTR